MGCKRDPNKPHHRMKRSRLRPVANTEYRRLELQADRLWSTVVRLRAKGRCEVCGQPGHDSHHFHSRTRKHLRHDPANGVLLCRLHHDEWHNSSIVKLGWLQRASHARQDEFIGLNLNEVGPVTKVMLLDRIEKLKGMVDKMLDFYATLPQSSRHHE